MSQARWDWRFYRVAREVASWSKDRATKVGAVIVYERQIVSTGYNGFPRGVDDTIEQRHARPTKDQFTEHAERNAVLQGARLGVRLQGSTLYLCAQPTENWRAPPCCDCARAIIQAGIQRVVGLVGSDCVETFRPEWRESVVASLRMFYEAGVEFATIDPSDGEP